MNGREKENLENGEEGDNKVEENSQTRTGGDSSGKQTSSSSSGPQTSSSGATGTTASSADTVPTQEAATIPEEGTEAEESAWGVLYPIDRSFYPLDLHEDTYTFGRGFDCNYSFDIPSIKHTQHFKLYSKKHFTIKRTKSQSGAYTVMLIDSSMNGVFINGEKLPEKGARQLADKDEIALSVAKNRILIYFDKNRDDDPNLPQLFKDKYIMHKVIGKGAFGEVREAMAKFGVGRHAVKIINKQKTIFNGKDPNKINEDVIKEARLLLNLHHPCVIRINDVIDSPTYLYLVLELACGGELFTRISECGQMKENVAKLIYFQMASAVAYLHENNITHRDLKPENILMMSDEEECLIKITDFGVSRFIGDTSLMKTQAGTPCYLAPEIIRMIKSQGQGYTKQVDSWSMGVILYICLAAYPPFARDRKDTEEDLISQILNRNFNFNHVRWSKVTELARTLISDLLTVDANKRTTPKQSLHHEWLKDDAMLSKARALMESTVVSTPSDNYSMINRIQQNNDDAGSGFNIVVQEQEVSDASTTQSSRKSDEKRAEKRHLPSDTSSESNKSNGDGDSLHRREKHFAGVSTSEPDTPQLRAAPKFDK